MYGDDHGLDLEQLAGVLQDEAHARQTDHKHDRCKDARQNRPRERQVRQFLKGFEILYLQEQRPFSKMNKKYIPTYDF